MRIKEESKKTGYFWLPENPEVKIPGNLSISNGGVIELEIVNHFNNDIRLFNENNLGRIIGHVEKDGFVTLDGCFYTKKSISFGGIAISKIHVAILLSGATWEKEEALHFNSFTFAVDCLDEWVGITGIKVDNDYDNKTTNINYKLPDSIPMNLNNGMKLEIGFLYTTPQLPALKEAKITQRAYFRLKSEELRELEEYTSIAYKITNLMCFAMDEVVSLVDVCATTSEKLEEFPDGKSRLLPIFIYYKSLPFSERVPKRNRSNLLFDYNVIAPNAELVFNKWLDAYEYLSPALSLYFSAKAGDHKYLDGKFLALAQGLETYHRRTSSETLMETDAFNKLVSGILENCPPDNLDWLRGRLAHGNEINLGKRLKKIIEPFNDHIGASTVRSKLLRWIVDTRNYLTHYSEDLREKAATGKDLYNICLKMEAIFNLHFLKVIGLTDDEITQIVRNSNELRRRLKGI